jgi:hypothetical protein
MVVLLGVSGVASDGGLRDVASLHLSRTTPLPHGIDRLPHTATVYRVVPYSNRGSVERLARALGITGAVTEFGGAFVAVGGSYILRARSSLWSRR